ncbi:transporter associated domain-containing protein [Dactylosporangium darangshiense]|uniref:transporter associated domain-containing protein n=1 Tax=Dactylosporangium darangshiense TaxID=579108 RepID=UPI003633C10B
MGHAGRPPDPAAVDAAAPGQLGAVGGERPRGPCGGRRPAPPAGRDRPGRAARPRRHPARLHPPAARDHLRRRRDRGADRAGCAGTEADGFALPSNATVAEAAAALAATGHARAPVVDSGDLDSAAGIVHWADLVTASGGTVRDVMRPALLLPESLPLAGALQQFKAERQEFALVVDERGAVDGIVTLADVVEEVFGSMTGPPVRHNADGSVLLPGTFPVHDLADVRIGLELSPDAPFTTVAGLVLARLGRLPSAPGDTVAVQDWRFTVAQVRGRAITAVTATRAGAR